jgi:hypothetical protein
MATEVDGKISLEIFSGYAGCDLFKNKSPLVASQPLISHTTVDVQKRFCG